MKRAIAAAALLASACGGPPPVCEIVNGAPVCVDDCVVCVTHESRLARGVLHDAWVPCAEANGYTCIPHTLTTSQP